MGLLAAAGVGATLKIQHDNEVKELKAQKLAEQKQRAAERRKEIRTYQACLDSQSEVVEKLTNLNARLDVGMNYRAYSDATGDVNVAFETALAGDPVDEDCLTDVAGPAGSAVDEYVQAARRWNECIGDYDCDVDDINLQGMWSRASEFVDEAEIGLSGLEPVGFDEADDSF